MNREIKELMNKKIKMKDLADIIIKNGYGTYKNLSNKLEGDIKDVSRGGKKVVIYDKDTVMTGYYAEYDEEQDAIVLLILEFIQVSWTEINRVIITKNHLYLKSEYETYFWENRTIQDATGNYNGMSYGRSLQIIREYLGGFYFNDYGCKVINFNNIHEMFDKTGQRQFFPYIEKEDTPDNVEVKKLPNEFKTRVILSFNKRSNISNNRWAYGYLQKAGNGYLYRVFICLMKETMDKLDVDFFECKQLFFDKDTFVIAMTCDTAKSQLIFYDKEGINDGMFKYHEYILKKASNIAKRTCRTCEMHYKAVSLAHVLSVYKNGLLDKIHHSPYQALRLSVDKRVFGQLNTSPLGFEYREKKRLHQIIGVPLHMLQILGNDMKIDDVCESIKQIKDMFDGYNDFLQNMDNKSVDRLISILRIACGRKLHIGSDIVICVNQLVTIYGPHNFEEYIRFISTYHMNGSMYYYERYLEVLEKFGDMAKDIEWKVKSRGLFQKTEKLEELFSVSIESDKGLYSEIFEKKQEEWGRYEYEKGNFLIKYPTHPREMAIEGMKLNHCVKEFIVPVAEGKTIILFIRRKSNPQKPYYTLEIKNNAIRQCHGVNNSKINRDIEKFLREFCRQKGITFTEGRDALGV